ncbi:MAG: aspartate aminotransferase family protein [Microthrixaceae bacterium]
MSNLWGQFSQLTSVEEQHLPVMVRGEGCYVFDQNNKRYLDGLSGLFTVQVGHGRKELAEAAAKQAEKLAYFPIWSYGTEPALELAAELASLAPGDLNRVFFTTGGSEAVESAWKLARQYFAQIGQPSRIKIISRYLSYHGSTMGALSITGLPAIKNVFEPLVPGAVRVRNTNSFRDPDAEDLEAFGLRCAQDIARCIEMEGPSTVAAVILEPVQNTGGALVPPPGYFARVREICDHYGVLLISDEVICAFGRLGYWFGAERYDYQPDIITFAKGLTSGYSPLGGMMISEALAEPFLGEDDMFLHGLTFAGHPVSCAVALANIELIKREKLLQNVLDNESVLTKHLRCLEDLPIVGDVRGEGYLQVVELVKDPDTLETFSPEECKWLLKGLISQRLFEEGLMCRTDDRAEPLIVLSPPLIAGEQQFAEIEAVLRTVLSEAWDALQAHSA